jgi:hypothetical protein
LGQKKAFICLRPESDIVAHFDFIQSNASNFYSEATFILKQQQQFIELSSDGTLFFLN